MKVLMAAPFESKGRYKGGIGSVVNNMLFEKNILAECDLEIEKFNTCVVERSVGSDSSLNISNIKNTMLLYYSICKYIFRYMPDVLYYHSSIKYALLKDLIILRHAKMKTQVKTVIHIHFADYKKIMPGISFVDNLILLILKKYVDEIIFLSETTKNSFIEHGIDNNKCSVIYNFNTLKLTNFNIEKINYENKPVELIFVGTIGKRKGFFDLVKALEKIDENKYILHVCGEPANEESKIEFEECKKKLKNSLVYHGFVTGEEKISVYQNSDILILPSYGEGLPMVILEAFSAGCAIISTNVGAIPEIVRKENGIILEAGKVDELTDAIRFYLCNPEELIKTQHNNYLYSKEFTCNEFIKKVAAVCKKGVESEEKA